MTNKNLVTQLHETVFHEKTRLKFFVLLVNFWLHGTSINQSINQSIIYFNTLHQRAKKNRLYLNHSISHLLLFS